VGTLGLATGTAAAAGSPAAGVTLGDIPQIIAGGTGEPTLALDFAQTPDPSTLRAGIAAASAFSGLSKRGVTIITVVGATAKQIHTAPMSVIEIDARPGPTRVSLTHLAGENLLLTLKGQGQGLLNAAKVLSTSYLGAFDASQETVPESLTRSIAKLDTATRGSQTISSGTVSGDGTLSLSRQIAVPVDKVIEHGQATLQLGVEYDAPGGGRLTFQLNGQTLGASESKGIGRTVIYKFDIDSVWTDGSDLLPGYYLDPGPNTLTVTAQPRNRTLAATTGTQLGLLPHSALEMKLTERRPLAQLDLWPFPLFDGSWAHTTVVMPSPAGLSERALSTFVTAMANTERLTGVAADPQITYAKPTAAQRDGNLLVFGNPQTVAGITPDSALVPGLITEQRLAHGGFALLATDTRALSAFAGQYYPGSVSGRTAVVNADGQAHTLVGAPYLLVFATPTIVWLKPAAGLAALILAWVAFRVYSARRRLRSRAPMAPGGVVS
jgi:hypothetical protein